MGPLIFFIFINDLSEVDSIARITDHADDIVYSYKNVTWENLKYTVVRDIFKILKWFEYNGLTVYQKQNKRALFWVPQ